MKYTLYNELLFSHLFKPFPHYQLNFLRMVEIRRFTYANSKPSDDSWAKFHLTHVAMKTTFIATHGCSLFSFSSPRAVRS